MGMFDTIFCERKLPLTKEIKKAFPDRDWSKYDFQTKSLDNTMSKYVLKKNGFLCIERVEGEYVRTMTEEEECEYRKKSRWCWPYKFVESGRSTEKYNITTVVNFYCYDEDSEGNSWDIEFDAVFDAGKLKSLKLVKSDIIATAEENKKREAEWLAKVEAHEKHPWTKTKKILDKITFGYWSTFWRNLAKHCYTLSRELTSLQSWIYKNMY